MRAILEVAHRSLTGRWIRASWLYRAACAEPRPETERLEHAAVLCWLRRIPWCWPGLLAVAGVGAVAGLAAGYATVALVCVAFVLAFALPLPALLTLPTLLIWGPRLNLALSGDEVLFLRLDQPVVAGLLCYLVLHPRGALRSPPGHTVFLAFLGVVMGSILLGIVRGTLVTPVSAALYSAQWLEFYGLYVVAWSLGPRISGQFAYAWALPLLALAAYGLAEEAWPYYAPPGERYRTFERVLFPGQANHAAGLLALATVTGVGLALQPRYRALGIGLAVMATLALGPTGSRSGAVAWAAGLCALVLIRIPAARWWLPPLGVLGIWAVPLVWWQRASAPGSSMYDRLVAWKSALSTVDTFPLLGLGAGARHRSFYDNHYVMTLAESGVVGLGLLLLLMLVLGHALGHGRLRSAGGVGVCTGALAGLATLGVHALANVSFVVTLVGGPFFWYCGVALSQADRRHL